MPGATTEERLAEFERRLAELVAMNGGSHEEPPPSRNAIAERRRRQPRHSVEPTPEQRGFLAPRMVPRGAYDTEWAVPNIVHAPYYAAKQLLSPEGQYRLGQEDAEGVRLSLEAAGGALTGSLAANAITGIETNSLGTFIGRIGANNLAKAGRPTAKLAIEMAEAMEAQGAKPSQIRDRTNRLIETDDPGLGGVHKGADGQWRLELDDSTTAIAEKGPKRSTLGRQLGHPDLYEAYPDLASYPLERHGDFVGANFTPSTRRIRLGDPVSEHGVLGDTLHEAQHGIQSIENFARGSSIDTELAALRRRAPPPTGLRQETIARAESELARRRRTEPSFLGSEAERQLADTIERARQAHLEDTAADRYVRAAGEQEAYNTGWRLPLSAAERRRIHPNRTQVYPNSRQRVFFDD